MTSASFSIVGNNKVGFEMLRVAQHDIRVIVTLNESEGSSEILRLLLR